MKQVARAVLELHSKPWHCTLDNSQLEDKTHNNSYILPHCESLSFREKIYPSNQLPLINSLAYTYSTSVPDNIFYLTLSTGNGSEL
jgi:hypothetical protein